MSHDFDIEREERREEELKEYEFELLQEKLRTKKKVTKKRKLSNLNELEHFINGLGWYTGHSKLSITHTGEFEGYYGRASESWEHQTIIELKEVLSDNKKVLCPAIKVVGARFDSIEDVAKKVLERIKNEIKI